MASLEKNSAMSVVTWARPNVAATRGSGTIQIASHDTSRLERLPRAARQHRAAELDCLRRRCREKQSRRARQPAMMSGKGAAKKKMATKADGGDGHIVQDRAARAARHAKQRLDDDHEYGGLDAEERCGH